MSDLNDVSVPAGVIRSRPNDLHRSLSRGRGQDYGRVRMHELSLVMDLLEICEQEALRRRISKIEKIILEVGELSGVSVSALRFAFKEASPGTIAEFAELEIDEQQGSGWCNFCDRIVPLHDPLRACPECGRTGTIPVGGMEFLLREFVIREDLS